MSNFEVNNIVKCMCNEGFEELLIEGEYYVVTETYSTATDRTNIKIMLLGNDILDDVYYRGVRFDKVSSSDKEDIRAIINKKIDPLHPHAEVIKQLVSDCGDEIIKEINEEIKKLLTKPIQLSQFQTQISVSHNLSQVLTLALNNTSEEEVLNSLYQLLPLSEIKLGARYKHVITGKEYYVVQDVNHNTHLKGMNYYLLIDADTHQSANRLQESEYSMRLLIRKMGLQLAE